TVYSHSLVNKSVIQILKNHRFVKQVEPSLAETGLSVVYSFPILQEINKLDLGPGRVDIGKLAVAYKADQTGRSAAAFVSDTLANALNNKASCPEQTDIVLYGFGRIGRLLA